MDRTSKIAAFALGAIGVVLIDGVSSRLGHRVFTGCVDSKGSLRIIDTSKGEACHTKAETQITWNEQGVQGPQGPQGRAAPTPRIYIGDSSVLLVLAQGQFVAKATFFTGDTAIGAQMEVNPWGPGAPGSGKSRKLRNGAS